LPSSTTVPDIVFYWQMGAGETDITQFHYSRGAYRDVAAHPSRCGGDDDMGESAPNECPR
jgi:hypothetical protein